MKCGRDSGNPDLLLFNWTVFFIGLFFTTAVFEKSAEDMYRVFGGGCLQVFLDTFGKKHRVASPAVLLMARANSRPTQTQPSAAATRRTT